MQIDSHYVRLRATAREFALAYADIAAEADEAEKPLPEMVDGLARSGLPRLVVPARFGGDAERIDALAVTVVRESLMSVSSHLDTLFCMQGIGSFALSVGGSDRLREQWLPLVASMDVLAALALTEPDVGSDLRALTTSIRQVGDELVINGQKSFISNGTAAGFFSVLAREGDDFSMVLVPAAAAGVSVSPTPTVIAPHVMGEIMFDDARVPADHRIGLPGQGFRLVLATLGTFRVSVAGAAVGLAQSALDAAVEHSTTRMQGGRPMIEIGAIGQQLARAWAELEAARSFTYYCAQLASEDPRANLDRSSMAKVVATETAGRVTDTAVQVMGRFGLVRGSVVERAYRTARPMRTYEGGTEVILDSLARRLAQGHRS